MLLEEEVQKIGYISRSIPEGMDLKAAINQLKIEKKAVRSVPAGWLTSKIFRRVYKQ